MHRALFLDRDGVINVEKDYLYKIEDFEFIEGIFELSLYYQALGYKIFVVTNQSGISRNYYTEEDFSKLSLWMLGEFRNKGIEITQIYHCPHHEKYFGECECRKPKPGMLFQAAKDYNIDLKNSVLVGDKERDIEAALNAGIVETYLFDESNSVKSSKATKIVHCLKEIIDADFK
ncbi:MAG: HAD family hydrolase [Campylobacterales bacterium]|nr:HAD family hydrolase [Campylobacterales bacterium]